MTDTEIIENFKDPLRQRAAFEFLVKNYQQKMYWHIRKMVIDHDDADDLVQEVFIKVWQSLGNFRGDSKLYTWLYRIATNECLTHLQKKRRQNNVSIDEDDSSMLYNSLESSMNSNYVSGEEIQIKLQKAILQLPDKQRLVFNMKYYDDLSYEEIADITGTTVGGLKATYHLATKKIEEFLKVD